MPAYPGQFDPDVTRKGSFDPDADPGGQFTAELITAAAAATDPLGKLVRLNQTVKRASTY